MPRRPRLRPLAVLAALLLAALPGWALAASPVLGAAVPVVGVAAPPCPVNAASRPCPPLFQRYFPQTGFAVERDQLWNYFLRRGGVATFGYPTSRTVRFLGFPTQFFQRQVMQLWPDGSVHLLNLLDPAVMPYTTFNFSTFPAVDPALVAAAPSPGDPDYGALALAFVRAHAPDTWNGLPVNFAQTFDGTVSPQAAFPDLAPSSPQVRALLPLIQLEVWGLPTSAPAYDPANHSFVYLRFQRGVMMFDAGCSCTQGVLFGDYFKAIIIGPGAPGALPRDLAQEAAGSRFFAQYAPDRPGWLARPDQLPDSDLTEAFTPQPRPLGAGDCGSVTIRGASQAPADAAAAQAAEGCFAAAVPACAPATLEATWMGVDAGVTRTFSLLAQQGGCAVGDQAQHYMVPARPGGPQSAATYTCAGVDAAADGLHFRACGADGDVTVPSGA